MIVKDDGTTAKGTSLNVGDTVKFKLTSHVPNMSSYDTYTYIVIDTLSSGLDPVTTGSNYIDVTVTIDNSPYTEFTVAPPTGADKTFTITFNNFIQQKDKAGKDIVITYSATLNSNALTAEMENNTVKLTYSNDPSDSGTGETIERKVYIYDFDIVINKVDAADNTPLENAKFVLKNSDGKYYYLNETDKKVTWYALTGKTLEAAIEDGEITEVITDADGSASFTGLAAGTYSLHETQAPQGYNKIEDKEVTITAEYNDNGELNTSSAKLEGGRYVQTIKVENKAGSLLPSTGGIGTTIFYVGGIVLIAAAVVLFVVRSRKNSASGK